MGSVIQEDLFSQLKPLLVKVGVDEVGRGCIAGPVVACACFALNGCLLPKVYDSKSLSSFERESIFLKLIELDNFHFAFGVVSNDVIDQINILQATFRAMRFAIERLPQKFDEILVDGSLLIPGIAGPQRAIIKGDAIEPIISAASVLAKVFRDKLMDMYAKTYPGYGFDQHKGYGTAFHLDRLEKFGAIEIHRKSFAPLNKANDSHAYQLQLEEFFI